MKTIILSCMIFASGYIVADYRWRTFTEGAVWVAYNEGLYSVDDIGLVRLSLNDIEEKLR